MPPTPRDNLLHFPTSHGGVEQGTTLRVREPATDAVVGEVVVECPPRMPAGAVRTLVSAEDGSVHVFVGDVAIHVRPVVR